MNPLTTTPFVSTIEHLAGQFVDQRVAAPASGLERLKEIILRLP